MPDKQVIEPKDKVDKNADDTAAQTNTPSITDEIDNKTSDLNASMINSGSSHFPLNQGNATEIRLVYSDPPHAKNWDAKVVIPWGLSVISTCTALFLYIRGRKNKFNDDYNGVVIDDIKNYLAKINELAHKIATHQSGNPCSGINLRASREHLTNLRKSAQPDSLIVEQNFQSEMQQKDWREKYRIWKNASEGDTDWITNKKNSWSNASLDELNKANENYIWQIPKANATA